MKSFIFAIAMVFLVTGCGAGHIEKTNMEGECNAWFIMFLMNSSERNYNICGAEGNSKDSEVSPLVNEAKKEILKDLMK
jgi:hypothetical protein